MEAFLTYPQYLKKIEKLKNALKNNSCDDLTLKSKLKEITQILKHRGICAGDDLLDNELIEKLGELFFIEGNEQVNEFFCQLYSILYFKGKSSKKLREEFIPIYYSNLEEREPNNREKLYDKIITLQYYEYNNFIDNKVKNNYKNSFQQKFNEIKNLYSKMLKQGVDIDLYKYDEFDKEFFDGFLGLLNNINEEIYHNKKQKNASKKERININNYLSLVKGIPLSKRTFFYNKEKLIYGEDMQIEYKNYSFPFTENHKEEFKKQICGFLNSKGGRIFIGINDDKIVNGILLKYHEKDKNTNEIVNLTYDFYPKCRTCIDVNFIPIKNKDNNYIKNLYVIKIIVAQGEPNKLYSYTTKGFNSYLRLKGQCINLTAEEIRNELFKREKHPQNKINAKEFKDPEPDNPELIKVTESLEKQFKNINLNGNLNNQKISTPIHQNQQSNKRENRNNFEKYNDYSDNEEFNEDEEDEEQEEEEEEIDNFQVRGRGRGGGRGNGRGRGRGVRGARGNIGTKRMKVGNERENKSKIKNEENNHKFTIKINVVSKTGKYPSLKEIRALFNNINKYKRKFLRSGKKIYGYLNFENQQDAILFNKNFVFEHPLYEIHLNPKF